MKLADADRKKLVPLLGELARAVEELLLSGLTTASEATRQTLHIALQEASRLRLLRLGATLRAANEELGRFTRNEPEFSRKRMAFHLNRTWLLSQSLARALAANDEAGFERLSHVLAGQPVERLEVVTIGVVKKVVARAAATFDFRMRAVKAIGAIAAGQRLSWSCVFPIRAGADMAAECYLHLPQKQRFKAVDLLKGEAIVIEKGAVSSDSFGAGRISLTDASTVALNGSFSDWKQYPTWDPAAALARIQAHQVGPFDLELELQEEVVLDDWEMGEAEERADGQTVFPIESAATRFDAIVAAGVEGQALRKALEALRKKKRRPPLFGLLHYERCRLVLQVLSALGKDGPEYLTISDEKLDQKALLKALNLT